MAFLEFLGDVVDAPTVAAGLLVLAVEATHQTGNRLVNALNGDRRAALGRLQTRRDRLD